MGNNESKSVLLVDKGSTGRKLLAVRLQNLGFETVEVGSPAEMDTVLSSRSFDLVLCEMGLPGLEGKDFFLKFREMKCSLLVFTDKLPEGDDWKTFQVKGLFHKTQRAELLKKIEELFGEKTTALPEREGQKNILLVEDSLTIRNMLRKILEKNFPGSVIREAADGREAMAEMSNKKVDFIITDLQMSGMDGQAFLKVLHGNSVLRNKPVIVLSSSITQQLRDDLAEYKSVRLLAKPSSAEEISQTVRSMMGIQAGV